jgi:hypothetical protein
MTTLTSANILEENRTIMHRLDLSMLDHAHVKNAVLEELRTREYDDPSVPFLIDGVIPSGIDLGLFDALPNPDQEALDVCDRRVNAHLDEPKIGLEKLEAISDPTSGWWCKIM